MRKRNLLKHTTYYKSGDKLEVKLRDQNYNPIYKNEVSVKNVKDVSVIITDLEMRGVPIKEALKYKSDDFWEL